MTASVSTRGGGITRAAALLAVLAAASAVFGFVRDVVIASVFGASGELDAYLVAQGLMNVVLGLVAGAMAKASVPVVARGVSQGRIAPLTTVRWSRWASPSPCS